MKIYRFEDGFGEGPYRGTRGLMEFHTSMLDEHKHQIPADDPYLQEEMKSVADKLANIGATVYKEHFYFGFYCIEQMSEWFSGQKFYLMMDAHFHVVEYEVKPEHVAHGERQIAFLKTKSCKVIEKHTPLEFYELHIKSLLEKRV